MEKLSSRPQKIRVAILDDHQSTLDGYTFRLSKSEAIKLVGTARFGEQLEPMLAEMAVDLLVLDVGVPISEADPNPYPLLHIIPKLLAKYPDLAILIISMHKQRTMIQALMDAGAKGYIVKDDTEEILKLADIVRSVAAGGIYFSKQSYRLITGSGEEDADFQILTPRQVEALSLYAAQPNLTTADLAKLMNIAPSTLRNLLSEAYFRLKVNNRSAAIAKARQFGIITPYSPDSNTGG
ncbi:MAG: response regulator transcription factor [Chloroflexi bacterium]|nr:response regulator transcription factor [Chloroflexota bacterium]